MDGWRKGAGGRINGCWVFFGGGYFCVCVHDKRGVGGGMWQSKAKAKEKEINFHFKQAVCAAVFSH